MSQHEKMSTASTDVEAQEAQAFHTAPLATPGQALDDSKEAPNANSQAYTFPEGGRRGWMTIVGAWAVMFITFGYINAWGVYQTYYLTGPLRGEDAQTVAWIGSLQMFFQFSFSLVSGPLVDKLGPRLLIGPSAIALVLAQMLTSLCNKYWEFMLCQGVFGGICSGMLYSPAATVVGHYFHKKRPLAMGIIASGSALGGILYPIILDKLLNGSTIGFGWTQRIVGFIGLFMAIIAIVTIKPGIEPRKGTYLIPAAFKQPAYSLQVLGLFITCWGLFTPFFYIPAFAQSIGMSSSLSFYLITFLNAGSFFGRLIAGASGVAIGQFNVLFFCALICGVMVWSWLSITSNAGIIVLSVFYGAFSGGIVSTMISTIAACAPHPSQMGTYIGMSSAIFGVAALTGTPINGALLDEYHSFDYPIYFSGSCIIVGTVIIGVARLSFAPITKLVA